MTTRHLLAELRATPRPIRWWWIIGRASFIAVGFVLGDIGRTVLGPVWVIIVLLAGLVFLGIYAMTKDEPDLT